MWNMESLRKINEMCNGFEGLDNDIERGEYLQWARIKVTVREEE